MAGERNYQRNCQFLETKKSFLMQLSCRGLSGLCQVSAIAYVHGLAQT